MPQRTMVIFFVWTLTPSAASMLYLGTYGEGFHEVEYYQPSLLIDFLSPYTGNVTRSLFGVDRFKIGNAVGTWVVDFLMTLACGFQRLFVHLSLRWQRRSRLLVRGFIWIAWYWRLVIVNETSFEVVSELTLYTGTRCSEWRSIFRRKFRMGWRKQSRYGILR